MPVSDSVGAAILLDIDVRHQVRTMMFSSLQLFYFHTAGRFCATSHAALRRSPVPSSVDALPLRFLSNLDITTSQPATNSTIGKSDHEKITGRSISRCSRFRVTLVTMC